MATRAASRAVAVKPLTDADWNELEQTIPRLSKQLPKTNPNEPQTMTAMEFQTLKNRIEDLRKVNDQLVFHRLPIIQSIIATLSTIYDIQHNRATKNNSHEDDLTEIASKSIEQQLNETTIKADRTKMNYHAATQRLENITSQFHEYEKRTEAARRDLHQYSVLYQDVQTEFDELSSEGSTIRSQITSLDQQLLSITTELTTLKEHCDEEHAQLQQAEQEYANLSHNFQTESAQLEQAIRACSSDINTLQQICQTLISESFQHGIVLQDLDEQIYKLSLMEELRSEYQTTKYDVTNELEKLKQTETKLQEETKGAQQRINSLDLELEKVSRGKSKKDQRIKEYQSDLELLEDVIVKNGDRLADLKSALATFTSTYHQAIATLTAQHQAAKAQLEEDLGVHQHNLTTITQTASDKYVEKQQEFSKQKNALSNQLKLTKSKLSDTESGKVSIEKELVECSKKITDLRAEIKTYQEDQNSQSNVIQQRFMELQQQSLDLEYQEKELKRKKLHQLTQRREYDLQQVELAAHDVYRRKLHNILQDLKGNIRVMCRIRPIMANDSNKNSSLTYQPESGLIQLTLKEKLHPYQFETIMGPDSTQIQVFEEVRDIVQSAIDGYNVCLFSYGQTGSGKSHTMTGVVTDEEHKGIIPRSVDLMFASVEELRPHGWDFTITVSACQIYLDRISDLLVKQSPTDFKIIMDHEKKKTVVQGLTQKPVSSTQDVYRALNFAHTNRVVASTGMNAQSSRSHFVFTFNIEMVNSKTDEKRMGTLNLCDLAGSERVDSAKTTGEQLNETKKINASLSALNQVFRELASQNSHISFKSNKLTLLLQDCLSGEGKTLMIVNLSPDPASASETNGSLQLAQTVSAVQRGATKMKDNLQALRK